MILQKQRFITSILFTFFVAGIIHGQDSTPIEDPNPAADLVAYIGEPATSQPIETSGIPEHPFMQSNEQSNIHNDAYMSDTYTQPGPLGINPQVSSVDLGGICATITFDSHGRIITSCLNLNTANLYVLNADTLEILDTIELPYRNIDISEGIEFPAGSYFYMDHEERILIPVVGNKVWRMSISEDGKFGSG